MRSCACSNRVVGGDMSRIAGEMRANGIVYLTNPAGIVFTPGDGIDVAGLYAAAGTLRDTDFLSGTDYFRNLQGSVINRGDLTGQAIHLLGQRVRNYGSIRADHGFITMVAGNDVLLRQVQGRVYVKVDGVDLTGRDKPAVGHTTPDLSADPGVENTGTVQAAQGQVTLGAGDMYALAVRNTGRVAAAGGEVNLTAADGAIHNAGTLSASAQGNHDAGRVTVQGPSIVNAGRITADADTGSAGSITFTSDKHTYLLDGSSLSATGGAGQADGGNVAVHSYHGLTVFSDGASINVAGGASGGRGGFVEVSGQTLAFQGNVNLTGPGGYGYLLIDPRDLTIADTASHDFLLADNQITFNEPDNATDITISDEALEALFGNITLQADRDLTVAHAVALTHFNTVTLQANRHLRFDAPINGALNLIATADANHTGLGTLTIATPLTDIYGSAMFSGANRPQHQQHFPQLLSAL